MPLLAYDLGMKKKKDNWNYIKELNLYELIALRQDCKKQLLNFRFQLAHGTLTNTALIKAVRRNCARISTRITCLVKDVVQNDNSKVKHITLVHSSEHLPQANTLKDNLSVTVDHVGSNDKYEKLLRSTNELASTINAIQKGLHNSARDAALSYVKIKNNIAEHPENSQYKNRSIRMLENLPSILYDAFFCNDEKFAEEAAKSLVLISQKHGHMFSDSIFDKTNEKTSIKIRDCLLDILSDAGIERIWYFKTNAEEKDDSIFANSCISISQRLPFSISNIPVIINGFEKTQNIDPRLIFSSDPGMKIIKHPEIKKTERGTIEIYFSFEIPKVGNNKIWKMFFAIPELDEHYFNFSQSDLL
ncbi:MAG: 50S ribosomal protein L29 [Thalassospira sp.]|uniref:50S ribosomal protein L29 n=1 Tax=Thalassospira sp. TaxID=1912094 RepID=UPI0032ED92B4